MILINNWNNMTTNKKVIAGAFNLAKERIFKETGKKIIKHTEIIAYVEDATGKLAGDDPVDLLLLYGRVAHNSSRVYSTKQYTMNTAMQQAQKKAEYQPKMISMNSNVRTWSNNND